MYFLTPKSLVAIQEQLSVTVAEETCHCFLNIWASAQEQQLKYFGIPKRLRDIPLEQSGAALP